MQKQYLLSIIIPHYNSADLLERLLESIPKREDFQVIVVDDNSTKKINELQQCQDKYANANYLFLRNESGKNSAGTCRNIGVEASTGKWLLFADADDVFLDETDKVLETYMDSDYDIVYFTPTSYDYSKGCKANRHKEVAEFVNNYLEKQDRESELRLRYFHVCPWSKLIRKHIVDEHAIRFDSTMVSNDVMFSTMCGHYADKIAVTKEQIYCVTVTPGSLVTQSSEKNFDIRTEVLISKYLFLQQNVSKEDCKIMKIDGLPIGRLLETWKQYKSIKKVQNYLRMFRERKVRVFTWRMLNPHVVYKAIQKRQ